MKRETYFCDWCDKEIMDTLEGRSFQVSGLEGRPIPCEHIVNSIEVTELHICARCYWDDDLHLVE